LADTSWISDQSTGKDWETSLSRRFFSRIGEQVFRGKQHQMKVKPEWRWNQNWQVSLYNFYFSNHRRTW